MVESAPLFIEYCCQGYVNCFAFYAAVGALTFALVGTWIVGLILIVRD